MTYTALSFSFGALLTSSEMNAMFENFAALAAGDTGAPRIEPNALWDPSSGGYDAHLASGVQKGIAVNDIITYDSYMLNATKSSGNQGYTLEDEVKCLINGTYIFKSYLFMNGTSRTTISRLYVNNIAVGAENTVTDSAQSWASEPITVASGDLVQLYVSTSGTAARTWQAGLHPMANQPYANFALELNSYWGD